MSSHKTETIRYARKDHSGEILLLGDILAEEARMDRRIVVLAADSMKVGKLESFAEEFPERFFNLGISEQDMVSTAVGLALGDKKPVVVTFSSFLCRAWEQIKVGVCINRLSVLLVGTYAGISYTQGGATHHSNEDIALMNVLPNMTILVPSSVPETAWLLKQAIKADGPCFLRLPRRFGRIPSLSFEERDFGRPRIVIEGTDVLIMCHGWILREVMNAARTLQRERNISCMVVSLHMLKPLHIAGMSDLFKGKKLIVVVEEHSVIGGLYSTISSLFHENVPVVPIGIDDRFTRSGTKEELYKSVGLERENIVNVIQTKIDEVNRRHH